MRDKLCAAHAAARDASRHCRRAAAAGTLTLADVMRATGLASDLRQLAGAYDGPDAAQWIARADAVLAWVRGTPPPTRRP